MVTSTLYKSYSNQIAKLFCKDAPNKVLCEASISNRLNTFLDDYTYPFFLSALSVGRQYIFIIKSFVQSGFNIEVTDLITGETVQTLWNFNYPPPSYAKIPNELNSHKFKIISANKTYSAGNITEPRITHVVNKPTYGISFVPSQVPGYTPPGTEPNYTPPGTPPGGKINITPNEPNPLQKLNILPGENITDLFSNPLVLIGGGIALYLLLKD